jgi:thiol-disulfide isomerase/thioredoxin
MRRKIAYILAIALFIVAAYYGFYDNDKAQAITYQKPSPIPQFSVNLVYQNGVPVNKTVSINDFKGHYTLVNFFASWCPPCKAELPLFEQAYQKFSPYGFRILAVSMDDNQNALMNFLKDKHFTFDVAIHSPGLGSKFNVTGLPTSYLIDPNGNIIKVIYGEYTTINQDLSNIYFNLNEPR